MTSTWFEFLPINVQGCLPKCIKIGGKSSCLITYQRPSQGTFFCPDRNTWTFVPCPAVRAFTLIECLPCSFKCAGKPKHLHHAAPDDDSFFIIRPVHLTVHLYAEFFFRIIDLVLQRDNPYNWVFCVRLNRVSLTYIAIKIMSTTL
jgi:hypothetical protein